MKRPPWLLVLVILARATVIDAQEPKKVGILSGGSDESIFAKTELQQPRTSVPNLRRILQDLGWTEGRNIRFEERYAKGQLRQLPEFAHQLVQHKMDVIVAHAPAAVRAAKEATTSIPIVMAHGGDPVAQGFVASLARPDGNVTGVANLSAELSGKRLEFLKDVLPKLSRVAVLWNPDAPGPSLGFKELEAAAKSIDVPLESVRVRDPKEFKTAFRIAKERASGLIVIQDVMTVTHIKDIVKLAVENRIPAIYTESEWTDAGGLMSYGPSFFDLEQRAAVYVDKILKGAKPGDLPIEQPTKFELVINLKAAKQIRLTVPPHLLSRADRVIR
jgi:putative ABC transport system substrate-binding protein